MKKPNYRIQLMVDDIQLQPCEAVFLLQTDPFPGGHAYELRISNLETKSRFDFLSTGESKNLNEETSAKAAYFLNNLIEWKIDYEKSNCETKYFLNTIESLKVYEDELFVTGVCSEVQRK